MLEKDQQLFRVRTDEGILYVNSDELSVLEDSGKAFDADTISEQGEMALLTSQQLEDFRLIRLLVSSRAELARELTLRNIRLTETRPSKELGEPCRSICPPLSTAGRHSG